MRSSAFNYRKGSWNTKNISSLQKKVSLLLALNSYKTRSLIQVFDQAEMEPIAHEQLEQLNPEFESALVDLDDTQERFHQLFQEIPLTESPENGDRRLFEEILFLKAHALSGSILRNGIHLERYRVGNAGQGIGFQVIFEPDDRDRWWSLASYATEEEAITAANGLRRFLIRLNTESEGVHILEHILLRPQGRDAHPKIDIPREFYSFRISVVFPGWTARFHDKAFRSLAEETVHLNCPAHIYPDIYWLKFEEMKRFEGLYKHWLELKSGEDTDQDQLDAAAEQLIKFVLEKGSERQGSEGNQT